MIAQADLLSAAFHWVEYLGLLAGIGSFVVRRAGNMRPRIAWARPPMHLAFGAALAGGFLLLLQHPAWPVAIRVAAEAAAFYLCFTSRGLVAPFGVFAAAILPLSGHAAQLGIPGGAEFADALHVLSAAMWAGGILALGMLRPPDGWSGEEAHVLLERFGRVAFIAFGVTALTGVLRATEELARVSDLWSTSYGIVLALKSAGVLAMIAFSSLGWRRRFPVARLEGATAVAVVALTALLAAIPVDAP